MIRVGADIGLFRTLAENDKPFKLAKLAEATGATPELLGKLILPLSRQDLTDHTVIAERVARYLASNNTIKEVGINEYQASNITHIFASDLGEGMVYHGFNTHGPVIQALPDFLAANKYQDIISNTNTPFQVAHSTKLQSFDWMVQHPEHFASLQKVMTAFKGAEWTVGLDTLDIEAKKVASTPPRPSEKPFFVDVGGGHGHQCIQLGKKYPNLLGRLVLQDLPLAVNKLSPIEGVRTEAYDFFEKQPIAGTCYYPHESSTPSSNIESIGAKFYYLRRIMHDWPDKEAAKILQNVAGAMAPDSHILIDEIVMPDIGAHWEATMQDLAMMNMCAGKERSKQQWLDLADRAGLRVEKIHTYVPSTYTSVLVLALK